LPKLQPFTKAGKGDVSTHVLVTSLEEVYNEAVSRLHDVVERAGQPGFRLATGTLHGLRVSVALRPVGPSALAILLEELGRLGARVVLSLDTGLALAPRLTIGQPILAVASIKGDGVSKSYSPPEVPAIADFGLLRHIQQTLEVHNIQIMTGLVWSVDSFYVSEQLLEQGVRSYGKLALALDMDTAALYTVAMARKMLGASILVIESSLPKGVERGAVYQANEELHRKVLESFGKLLRPLLEALTLHMEKSKARLRQSSIA
jgi:uridine phosphorylase